MDLSYNSSTQSLCDLDEPVIFQQFAQLTFERNVSANGQKETYSLLTVSNGCAEINTWEHRFLSNNKEALYIRAMTNLFKKINFIELNQALETEDITEQDFDRELSENEEEYLISCPDKVPSTQEIIQITDIIRKIGRIEKMSVDEVSELFSLDMSKAEIVLQEKSLFQY